MHKKSEPFDIYTVSQKNVYLFIFGVLNPDIDGLYIRPPHLYTVATLPWEIQKSQVYKLLMSNFIRI